MNTPVIQCQYIGRSNKEFKVQKIREVKIRDFTESEMTLKVFNCIRPCHL